MIRCDAKHSNAEDWLNGAGEPEELLEDSEGESSRSPVPPPDLAQVHNNYLDSTNLMETISWIFSVEIIQSPLAKCFLVLIFC